MRLYLTRHGQTEWNLERRMQGWLDSPLTQYGKENAALLGTRLKDVDLDVIYTSPSGRARETAEIIRDNRALEIVEDGELREMGFGCWEGQKHDDIRLNYLEAHDTCWERPHLYRPVDGEDYPSVQERALRAVKRITSNPAYKNVLIVTHAITLKTILAYFENRPFERLWEPPYMHDTNLSLIEIEAEKHTILLHGDTSHLKVELFT